MYTLSKASGINDRERERERKQRENREKTLVENVSAQRSVPAKSTKRNRWCWWCLEARRSSKLSHRKLAHWPGPDIPLSLLTGKRQKLVSQKYTKTIPRLSCRCAGVRETCRASSLRVEEMCIQLLCPELQMNDELQGANSARQQGDFPDLLPASGFITSNKRSELQASEDNKDASKLGRRAFLLDALQNTGESTLNDSVSLVFCGHEDAQLPHSKPYVSYTFGRRSTSKYKFEKGWNNQFGLSDDFGVSKRRWGSALVACVRNKCGTMMDSAMAKLCRLQQCHEGDWKILSVISMNLIKLNVPNCSVQETFSSFRVSPSTKMSSHSK